MTQIYWYRDLSFFIQLSYSFTSWSSLTWQYACCSANVKKSISAAEIQFRQVGRMDEQLDTREMWENPLF